MTTVINNERINPLALTTMIEAKKVFTLNTSSYSQWVAMGWQFFFEQTNGQLYAVMTAAFPHGIEKYVAVPTVHICNLVAELTNYKR